MSVIINGSNTPTAGGVTYGDGTQYATTAAGTTGQVLLSAGSGAPTWGALGISGGGTNSTATPTAGGAGYGTGTAHAYTSAGTTGQVLTSQGTSAPIWATPATGALVYLSTVTAATSATVEIDTTINSTYNEYLLVVTNLLLDTDGRDFYMQLANAGTYITTASYRASNDVATLNTEFRFFAGANLRNNGMPLSFQMRLHYPSNTAYLKTWDIFGVCQAASAINTVSLSGVNTTATVNLNKLKFYSSSGNITSGVFRLYGIANS